MRNFRNLPKYKNQSLAKEFGHLLKLSEECTPEDCRWVAVTVFDHWLCESDSFDRITNASGTEIRAWDVKVDSFLRGLVEIEHPVAYRVLGRWPKRRLQFRDYIGAQPISNYIVQLFRQVYNPCLAFEKLRFHLLFQDYWTIYLVYKEIDQLGKVLELVAASDLFLLPVRSEEHLNQYPEIARKLAEKGLNKAAHAKNA